MNLEIYKTLWGHSGTLADAIASCRQLEWDGIEGQGPGTRPDRLDFRRRLEDNGLKFIAEICTAGSYVPRREASVKEHLESFRQLAEAATECKPEFLTIIGGCDAWSLGQSVEFFGQAIRLANEVGVPASFETHRSRSLFNPWITQDILRQLPEMRLTCDFSHWCVVCERLIDTESDILAVCAERALHIHARVGYDQGPQVPNPAAPEYAQALDAHERWWLNIWESQASQGFDRSTITPEFGPDGYLHTLPFTQVPVADLAGVNAWMGERQRRRFQRFQFDQSLSRRSGSVSTVNETS